MSAAGFRVVPAGDAALVVEFADRIDPAVNARAIGLAAALAAAPVAGVRDVVPTYRSVAVYFDPLRIDYGTLVARLEHEARAARVDVRPPREPIPIPVCYGGRFGPDLGEVAAFGRLTEDEVVDLHTAPVYRVFMIGFVPGFAYMGMVDRRIAMPRRPSPRVRVAAGSVGVAGTQTGVYPAATPGGWRLIGRTPLRPFDPRRREPFLLQGGDTVRFRPITREEFDRLALQDPNG